MHRSLPLTFETIVASPSQTYFIPYPTDPSLVSDLALFPPPLWIPALCCPTPLWSCTPSASAEFNSTGRNHRSRPWLEQLIDGGHLHPLENFVCIDDFTEPATIAAVNRVTTSAPHRRITLVWAFMSTMQPVFNVPRYNTLQELPCIGFDIIWLFLFVEASVLLLEESVAMFI
ncbi:hypothetical protein BDZ89DRAFT_1036124 [Hymenopellis radicata]|nr:hypothetical protein BDZ89DRAFT_1036124 [Hymenopellis radicata]